MVEPLPLLKNTKRKAVLKHIKSLSFIFFFIEIVNESAGKRLKKKLKRIRQFQTDFERIKRDFQRIFGD